MISRAGNGGPRTLSRTTDAKLDCVFVENALLFVVNNKLEAWPLLAPPDLSTPPCYYLIDEHGVVWVTVLDFADHVEIGDTRLDHQHVSTLSHIPGKV